MNNEHDRSINAILKGFGILLIISSQMKRHLGLIVVLIVILAGIGFYWQFGKWSGDGLRVLRVPNATLVTSGLTVPEELLSSESGTWLNPIGLPIPSGIFLQVDATYCYEFELRETWSLVFDAKRNAAFIVIPNIKPKLPVKYKINRDETVVGGVHLDSTWFWKFEDAEQIKKRMTLLKELNALLADKARSAYNIDLCKEDARHLAGEYISNWIIKQGYCTNGDKLIVEVFFDDENIYFDLPKGAIMGDFKP